MKPRAFTLIEMLLSIAVIAILAAIMTPVFLSFQTRNDIDVASMAVTRSVYRAQQLARSGEGDSTWGVNLSSGAVTIFKGTTYAGRDVNYDEIFSIPNNITLTGTSSVVFSKMYGLPSASSTITLTSVNNETRIVNINAKGALTTTGSSDPGVSVVIPGAPSVTLSVTPSSIAEAAGTATLTTTLSATAPSDVVVSLSYSGTATVTSDYTRPSSITILAGALTGTATLTAVQDIIYEGAETIIVDISSVTNANESGTQQVTVTINDDEPAPFTCGNQVVVTDVAGHTCNEAYPDYDKCTYDTVSIGTQCWMKQNLNIGERIDGYSTYQTNNSILEKFCYNETSGYCQSGGGLYEFNEAIQYSSEGAQGICPAGWHIPTNAEWATLSSYLTANGQSGTEGTALKAASPAWDGSDSVNFTALPVGILDSSFYYSSLNSSSCLRSSSLDGASFGWYLGLVSTVSTIDNSSYSLISGLSVRCLADSAPSSATVTLSATPSSIAEAAGATTLTATLSSTVASNVTVNLGYSGTATVTSDYTRPSSITILAGYLTGTATLTAVQDTLYEGNETIITDISSVTNATESGTQQVTTTITDDEAIPTVTLGVSPSSIAEAAGATTLTATLSNYSSSDVTVNLSYSGTATVTDDYLRSSTITISAGSLTGSATLTAVQDAVYEGSETIIADISSVVGANESGAQQVTVTIIDDDPVPFVCGTGQVTVTATAEHTCNTASPYYDRCVYDTVQVGTQCWLKQNMNVGTAIDGTMYYQTNNSILEKFCYSQNYVNCQTYGALYEFDESMQWSTTERAQGICPTGWHIPSNAEWTTLVSYLTANGQSGTEGTALKTTSPTWNGTNAAGFTALPAGYLSSGGSSLEQTTSAYLRSSTIDGLYNSWSRNLKTSTVVVGSASVARTTGYSIRCLKD